MTYHLPRVEHWIQNQNLDFYYTAIGRQLFSPPLAEYFILYGRILSGNNWLMNLVQWFAFVGSLTVIFIIARNLKLGIPASYLAVLFFVTTPVILAESTSTQNDLVVTFWILCTFQSFLRWIKNPKYTLSFACAFGLALLTKGTAYVILFPLTLFCTYYCLFKNRKRLKYGVYIGMIIILINTPHSIRNIIEYRTPLATEDGTMSIFSIESLAYTTFGNIYVNMPILAPNTIAGKLNTHLKDVPREIYPFGSPHIYSIDDWFINLKFNCLFFHEDLSINPIHSLILICSIFSLFVARTKKKFNRKKIVAAAYCLTCLSFFFFIPWQPWVMRLQCPLFALGAIVFGAFSENKIQRGLGIILCLSAVLPLLFNYTRPLFTTSRNVVPTNKETFYNSTREELIFVNHTAAYAQMKPALEMLDKYNRDDWEYPIFSHFYENEKKPFIKHIDRTKPNDYINTILIVSAKYIKDHYPEYYQKERGEYNLMLLNKNKDDIWDIVYSSYTPEELK